MQELKILNVRERKPILKYLQEQWGFTGKLEGAMLQSRKRKLYLLSPDVEKIDLHQLRIDSIGLYLGECSDTGVRVSIEGSQLIGMDCEKNILDLQKDEFSHWMAGEDLSTDTAFTSAFILIRHDGQFAGSGKYHAAEKKVLNHVPKARRIPLSANNQ